ncbi:alpha/beta fold hydrolase [Yinghuangia sp. YIM S10712]|uniref:alpha/beta fold hydrolase n=1 Tax=Yinghuangia sp. YIM S10712 TaxID=3436930 RepID=UPI003F537041
MSASEEASHEPSSGNRRAVVSGVVVDRATGPDGPAGTIVLLNSLGTTVGMWDSIVPLLARSFDVVRFDQRGHGTATAHPATAGLDDLAGDVLAVLDRLGVGRAHVAGVSIGGMIALRTAALAPDRILSLAPMCCAAVYDGQSWIERAKTVREHGVEAIAPAVMDRWFTPEFRERRPEIVRSFADMLGSMDREGYAVGCDVLAEADVTGDLAHITAPTLVVGGAEDPAAPPDEQRAIARAVPHARLEILPAVAHIAPAATPELVAELVTAHALNSSAV